MSARSNSKTKSAAAPSAGAASTNVPLAIIGIGCLFPKADNRVAYWSNIRRGVDAISPIPPTHWKPEDYFHADPSQPDKTYAQRGGFLDPVDFDPLLFGINPNNLEATDTTQLLGMLATHMALRDAGYETGRGTGDGKAFDRDRCCAILGVTGTLELVIPLGARLGHPLWRQALREAGVDQATTDDVVQRIAAGYVPWQENSFPGLLGNVAAGRIANRFDLGGTNCVVDAACASSLSAIHMAAMELGSGQADLAITGGLDTFNDIFMYMCFSKTPALSPTGDARPFSRDGDGTILGEGLGVVILKRLADAQRDGDHVYAVIKAIGSSSDGRGNAIYAPSATGQVKALRNAYRAAGITADTIELLEAHGTGTKVGDAVEVKALTEVYREAKPDGAWCALGSVKSMIGHTKAAAGAAGLIKAALALEHKVLPPTLKVAAPQDVLQQSAPVYVNTEARPWLPRAEHPRRAALSAFGFGGSNFHCVLEEAAPTAPAIDYDGRTLLLALSGASRENLTLQLDKLPTHSGEKWDALRFAAWESRAAFDAAAPHRLLLIVERDATDWPSLLNKTRERLQRDDAAWTLPQGATYASGAPAGKLAVVFPGQGAQRLGMLRELALCCPQFQAELVSADRAFGATIHGQRLSDRIYPPPAFDEQTKATQDEALRATDVTQPALGAVSLGAWRVLEHFGVTADAAAGHSFGELCALALAGAFPSEQLHQLAQARGSAMAQAADAQADAGAMLAVQAGRDEVEKLLRDAQLDVAVANHNAPRQVVLTGSSPAIAQAQELCQARQLRCKRLTVAAAFHSPRVAGAAKVFGQAVAKVKWQKPTLPVYANTTAGVYPDDAPAARKLLAQQLAQPVRFVEQIQAMYAAGVRTFVEAGPGSVLSGLIGQILADQPHVAVSVESSAGRRGALVDLAWTLAQLAAGGLKLALTQWDPQAQELGAAVHAKPRMTVKLCGANYVKPRAPLPPRPAAAVKSTAGSAATPANASSDKRASVVNVPSSAPPPAPPAPAPSGYREALAATQQSILALQQMLEQTARLHAQYLHGQEQAQYSVTQLIQQQQQLLSQSLGLPWTAPAPAAPPTAAPVMPVMPAMPALPPLTPAIAPVVSAPIAAPVAAPVATPAPAPVAPKAAAAPTPPATLAPSQPGGAAERFQTALLEVVAEKTGYPAEMLELDMSLDADLGIDSIKRVEILSALQDRLPDAPPVKPDDLASLHTLRQIVDFMAQAAPAPAPAPGPAPVAPQAAAAPTPPATLAPSQPGGAAERFQTALLEVVAEKTGYPAEMLELDMSLDADLGIDSIKRVEILSALQDRLPDAPPVKPDDLASLHTLRQIVDFMAQASTGKTTDPPPTLAPPPPPARSAVDTALDRQVVKLLPFEDAPRRRLRLPAGAPLWLTRDDAGLCDKLARQLTDAGVTTQVIDLTDPPAVPSALAGLVLLAPARDDATLGLSALRLLRQVGSGLQAHGKTEEALLAAVTRLGDSFALDGVEPPAPLSAALSGLVKTAAWEWPGVHCRVFDLPADAGAHVPTLADELLQVGPRELGLSAAGPVTPALQHEPLAAAPEGSAPLQPGDVVVVSGGARGVTAQVALALARSYQPTLLLLGRSAPPEAEPAWLANAVDEAGVKQAILRHAGNGQPLTPRRVQEMTRSVMAAREVRQTLAQLAAAGSQVLYRSVDVRDAQAVAQVLSEVRAAGSTIRGVVHGAGVLADKLILDKTDEQFTSVWETKIHGALALLEATRHDDLRLLTAFSSSTARFGRRGQCDYAAANECLNKLWQREARRRPDCRVLSINWGPWDGGMVNDALRQVFASEGVQVIPLEAGAAYLAHEAATPTAGPVEIVILGRGSRFPALDEVERPASPADDPPTTTAKSTTRVIELKDHHRAFARTLSVANTPVLRDHVLNHQAVLPTAVILEWLAHGALHDNPGLHCVGAKDLAILKGVTLGSDEEIELEVLTGPARRDGGIQSIPVALRSTAGLHAKAVIELGEDYPSAPADLPPLRTSSTGASSDGAWYADGRLFHGPLLHGITTIDSLDASGIVVHSQGAPRASTYFTQPLRANWLTDPLVIDAALQALILWSWQHQAGPNLPSAVGRYVQYRPSFPPPAEGCVIDARILEHNATGVRAQVIFRAADGSAIAQLTDVRCTLTPTLKAAFTRSALPDLVQR